MRKDLLEKLREYSYPIYKRNYLESLLNLEISPFGDIKRLNELDMNNLEKEIIKYNLTIKSINAINKSLPEDSRLKVNKYDVFDAEVSLNHDWQFISMFFNKHGSQIIYYDRTNVSEEKSNLDEELERLEDKYHHMYGVYYGHILRTKEEADLEDQIDDIKNLLFDVNNMEEDKELFVIDKAIREDLLLPSEERNFVHNDETYDTYDVSNNSSIKVYKKTIKKINVKQ